MVRAANSLNVLLGQIDAMAPNRNRASDGWIGDTNHQNRSSDHNPWYPPPNGGIVTARDFTHDPVRMAGHSIANTLVVYRDPRIKYIIWNRRIWSPDLGWRAYDGPNPHTTHVHLSVVASPACDSMAPWAGFTVEVPEVELADSMTGGTPPYFPNGVPPEAAKVGNLLSALYAYGRATSDKVSALVAGQQQVIAALTTIVAEVTTDPDLSAEAIKAIVDQALAENVIDEDRLADLLIEKGLTAGASKDDVKQLLAQARPTVSLAYPGDTPA